MPSNMKGLTAFIADIRGCRSKEEEQKRVDRELAKIRLRFSTAKHLSGYDKKKYVWKLLYSYMLGYEVDFGHFQVVELCASSKFSEKNAGYLACSLLLVDNTDILRLTVNSMKNDIASGNEHVAALALNTVANIGSAEFADYLFADVAKLLSPSVPYSPYIKRKACICLLRLYRRDNDIIHPEIWAERISALYQEKDIGLLLSVTGFTLAILEQGAWEITEWLELVPAVALCLNHIVEGDCPDHYVYYNVSAPWLQTKLLRVLQFFPPRELKYALARISAILHNILTTPMVQRSALHKSGHKRSKADAEKLNQSNAEHAILFEAMNLVIHLDDLCSPENMSTASNLLGQFISSTDANIRYLGLETMARLASSTDSVDHLQRWRALIMEKMQEPDISIRRQALNLLYAICRPDNWQQIVDELLELLGSSDPLLQEELVLKVAILAERNAPNYRWYVDVVFRMLECAPDSVADDVWYRVVQVCTGFAEGQTTETEAKALQSHAVEKSYRSLAAPSTPKAGGGGPHEQTIKLGAYIIGEFGHLLPPAVTPLAKFDSLNRHYERVGSQTKGIIVLALMKLLNQDPDELRSQVLGVMEDIQYHLDVELQQRACELLQMVGDRDLLEEALDMMPPYSDHIQQNNPLVRRLKFQNKSRAHMRNQLEEAAKSEGGVFRPGAAHGIPKSPSASNRDLPTNGKMIELPTPSSAGASPSQAYRPTQPSAPSHEKNAQESESESSGSGSEGEDESRGATKGPGPQELWLQLCIQPQGNFFVSEGLCIHLKQEYQTSQGRITIVLANSGKEEIQLRVAVPEAPFMTTVVSQAPGRLQPGEKQPHYIQVTCLQPFLQPLRYNLEYILGGRSESVKVPLMLPAVLTKFMVPAELNMQAFMKCFGDMAGPPREAQQIAQAKVPPAQWPQYLSKGFNMYALPESNQSTVAAAGNFHTGTQQQGAPPGTFITLLCCVKLDFNAATRQVRVTVRTQHPQMTSALAEILYTYFFVKGTTGPPGGGSAPAP